VSGEGSAATGLRKGTPVVAEQAIRQQVQSDGDRATGGVSATIDLWCRSSPLLIVRPWTSAGAFNFCHAVPGAGT